MNNWTAIKDPCHICGKASIAVKRGVEEYECHGQRLTRPTDERRFYCGIHVLDETALVDVVINTHGFSLEQIEHWTKPTFNNMLNNARLTVNYKGEHIGFIDGLSFDGQELKAKGIPFTRTELEWPLKERYNAGLLEFRIVHSITGGIGYIIAMDKE